jgi:Uma2 family endonuclease
MAEAAVRRMTAEEFLASEGEGDLRYELVDGVVVAMATPTDPHGTMTGNACCEIDSHLRNRPPCRAVVEAGIRIDEHNHYKADIAATCTEPRMAPYVEAPFLIVEVLSPTSEAHDVGVKVPRYCELPSVREIWLVHSRERRVQLWRRSGDAWVVSLPLRGEAGFRSDALEAEVTLASLYRNSGL